MTLFKSTLISTALLAMTAMPSFAQDAAVGNDMAPMASGQTQLPEICMTGGEQPAGEMPMSMNHEMDEAHMALMDGMAEMNQQMMTGMMAKDIDVAFVCGMVPHHQSAINMAQAELEHGDDQWAKDMAQKIIDAQEEEIQEMLAWLEDQSE